MKRFWNENDDISNSISIFTPIAIMAFNRFSGAGYIATTDMHHPAENVIAFLFLPLLQIGDSCLPPYS